MYNVTLRDFHGTIVAVENSKYCKSQCGFVALIIQHTMRMCHIAICSLPLSTIFFHIVS